MKVLLIIFFPLILMFCQYSSPTSLSEIKSQISSTADTLLSDSLKSLFKDDAAILAISEMNHDSLLKSSIRIPKTLIGKYYSKLIAVYNATDIQEAQEVKSIHNYTAKFIRQFVIGVDTSSSWINNLIKGNDVSGNPDFDQILSEYNLNILSINRSINMYFLSFETGSYVNAIPFLKLFKNIENILFAENDGIAGGGNIITSSKDSESIILKYSKGWGDCPAGCINRHFWEFSVTENIVTFLKEYGDKIP